MCTVTKSMLAAAVLLTLTWTVRATAADSTANGGGGGPSLSAGKAVFTQYCLSCHGPSGAGDGPAAAALNPKPANFHDPVRAAAMTEEKQTHVVTDGGPAEKLSPLMPPFGETLSPKQVRDVVAYIRSLH